MKQSSTRAGKKPKAADPEAAQRLARTALRPSVNAAAVVGTYAGHTFGADDVSALMVELAADIGDLKAGDLSRAEAMLFGQAHALQAIFCHLARRADSQELMMHWEAFLRMALKAQNQCRMTLETLATIKNPPVVYARQANIAHGPQQVNNGAPPAADRQGAGGIKSSQPAALETARLPTQGIFPAGELNQQADATVTHSHAAQS
jgi:hypothetical protein